YYYLDNQEALDFLEMHDWAEPGTLDRTPIALNRDNQFHDRRRPNLFLPHEAMISRFRAFLVLACQQTQGKVVVSRWEQGQSIHHHVTVPKVTADPERRRFIKHRETETLDVWPDAFFILTITEQGSEHHFHFPVEIDRATMDTNRYNTKLRAYFHHIV